MRDTALLAVAPQLMQAWSGAVDVLLPPTPGDPIQIAGLTNFEVSPGATELLGSMQWLSTSSVDGVTTPDWALEITVSYQEAFVTTSAYTARYTPQHMYPGSSLRVTLLDGTGIALATRETSDPLGDVQFSLASPNAYGVLIEFVWTSELLSIGSTKIDTPPLGVDVEFENGASCPADLTSDQAVDDSDFVGFASAYNLLDCGDPAMAIGCPADLNLDGFVDDSDFVVFVTAYNVLLCP